MSSSSLGRLAMYCTWTDRAPAPRNKVNLVNTFNPPDFSLYSALFLLK